MDALELKRALQIAIIEVENALLHNMKDIAVSTDWSRLDDPQIHLEFIRNHLQRLSDSLVNRKGHL